LPQGRRRDPGVLVRALLRTRAGFARAGRARDHVVQSELAEPDGRWRRGLPREPIRGGGVRARGLHGAAVRAGAGVGPGVVRGLELRARGSRAARPTSYFSRLIFRVSEWSPSVSL